MNLRDILLQPIPDMTAARQRKLGYRDYPLNTHGPRSTEPLVDIAELGIAGQSYYSRTNSASGQPIPGVSPTVWVRESIARRLADINFALEASATVAELLDDKVELYIDEGWRSRQVQQHLYEKIVPALLRQQNPDLSGQELLLARGERIAPPSRSKASPSPHATGAAVDVKLRYLHADRGFVPAAWLGKGGGTSGIKLGVAYPDHFEHLDRLTKADRLIQKNRRIFYWVMRGALLGEDTGFAVNPTEWWHWSYGDQLWAATTQAPQAFFPLASVVENTAGG